MSLTQTRLKELLDYDPSTGVFTWRERSDVGQGWNTRFAGTRAGSASGRYRQIRVLKKKYYEHRIAWLWVAGSWPNEIDHVDCNGLNNRWGNLRTCTPRENRANSRPGNTALGLKGVARDGNKYAARIGDGGITAYLGSFETKEEAHAAYRAKAVEVFGAFARWE